MEKRRLKERSKDEIVSILEKDSRFLELCGVKDYQLLLAVQKHDRFSIFKNQGSSSIRKVTVIDRNQDNSHEDSTRNLELSEENHIFMSENIRHTSN